MSYLLMTALYAVLAFIEHDGVRLAPGMELRLSDTHAGPLLAIGAIAPKVGGPDAAGLAAAAEPDPAALAAAGAETRYQVVVADCLALRDRLDQALQAGTELQAANLAINDKLAELQAELDAALAAAAASNPDAGDAATAAAGKAKRK